MLIYQKQKLIEPKRRDEFPQRVDYLVNASSTSKILPFQIKEFDKNNLNLLAKQKIRSKNHGIFVVWSGIRGPSPQNCHLPVRKWKPTEFKLSDARVKQGWGEKGSSRTLALLVTFNSRSPFSHFKRASNPIEGNENYFLIT